MKIHNAYFRNARILVAGDVMLDQYWYGPASRISPEAPVPVVRVDRAEERAGGAGNVALNIAALGAQVTVLSVTGTDREADSLERHLSAKGVTCRFQRLAGRATIRKLRILSRHQQLIRLDFEDGFPDLDPETLLAPFQDCLADVDLVVLSDYGKGALRAMPRLIAAAREAGKPVLVDPKGKDFGIYAGATIVTPNFPEFEAVVGDCRDEEEIVVKGRALRHSVGLEALLITRGEHGMTLLTGDKVLHLPARAREVYDVTGAGDTVISVLAAALAAGAELAQAANWANVAAGIVVGKLGTATATLPELRRALQDEQENRGILGEEELLLAVEDARAAGETIVMTNGCFDILHTGHVAYLEQAKRLGNRLIVAVNDDGSVRRLKGSGRPVNSLEQRMQVLAALGCVDWVVPFSEDTPERLICRVRPDFLVKGGDYRAEEVAGYDCVTANGGQVRILDYHAGHSTTALINAIRGDGN